MPSPQPMGSIKRPPIIRNGSSSSSVSGVDRVILSFQSFAKQTPPVEQKSSQPPPAGQRRASSSSPPRPRTSSIYATRRSSSVYSRSVSQFGSDNSSLQSAGFADEPLPPLPILLPVAYSASTPQLVEKQLTPPLLEPRTYSPLIQTPSPTASRASTPPQSPQHKPSILLPLPPVQVKVPQRRLRTVSLETARAEINSPGAVHLLPEELRAQTLGKPVLPKSKSHEAIRMDSISIISAGSSPLHLPEPTTLVDNQGRRRTLRSPTAQFGSEYPFPDMTRQTHDSIGPFPKPNNGFDSVSAALQQQRKASQDKVSQTLGFDDSEDQRGRTRQRGPRNMDYAHYLPKKARDTSQKSPDDETDAQKIAKEYHSLLTEQYRSPASSPGYYRTESDESIKSHMKMVPKPLFQTKPPAKLPGSVTGQQNDSFWSPYRLSTENGTTEHGRTDSSDSSLGPNPFEHPRTSNASHKRRSTSGSIPISPPSDMPSPGHVSPSRGRPIVRQEESNSSRRGSNDAHVSAFYPHVISRKDRKAKPRPARAGAESPPVPLISASQRSRAFEVSPTSLSPRRRPSNASYEKWFRKGSNASHDEHYRKASNASHDARRPPLHERIANGAAKYADLLTRPSDLPQKGYYPPMVTATGTAPISPHLMPSPVKSQPTRIHLGWSDQSKHSHDSSRDLIASPKRFYEYPESPKKQQFTHVTAPARPPDERAEGLREDEAPRRKGSIFVSLGLFDGWQESKAEKRREELKKVIKVVPNEPGTTAPTPKRRASTFGWM